MNWIARLAAVLMAFASSGTPAQANVPSSPSLQPSPESRENARQILAEWNFNRLDTSQAAGPPPSSGTGSASRLGGTVATFASGTGSSDPAADADSAWNLATFPPQGQRALTAGAEFTVDTKGFEGLRLRFDFRASNTASRQIAVQAAAEGSPLVEVARFTIETGGAFQNGLSADLGMVPGLADHPRLTVRIVSDFADGAAYRAVSGNYSAAGTWRFDMVSISGLPRGVPAEPPRITASPGDLSGRKGTPITITVQASGTAPLTYEWRRDQVTLTNVIGDTYSIPSLNDSDAGSYSVRVRNSAGDVTAAPFRLAVLGVDTTGGPTDPEEPTDPGHPTDPTNPGTTPTVTALAIPRLVELRRRLDPNTQAPLPNAEGRVVWVEFEAITTGICRLAGIECALLEDETGGIAVRFPASQAPPPPGQRWRIVGHLTQLEGMLVVSTLPEASTAPGAGRPTPGGTWISTATVPPALQAISPTQLRLMPAAELEMLEGRRVRLSEVLFQGTGGASGPLLTSKPGEIVVDRSGGTFPVEVASDSGLIGTPRPSDWRDMVGVLIQVDADSPWTDGYRLRVMRAGDVVSRPKPPRIEFANTRSKAVRPGEPSPNTYGELVVDVGEWITLRAEVTEPTGAGYEIETTASEGLPEGSGWSWSPRGSQTGATELVFVLGPTAADRGRIIEVALEARGPVATSKQSWRIHVPSLGSSRIALTEILVTPAASDGLPGWNPLRRTLAAPQPERDDEFLEWVNFHSQPVDLSGWEIAVDDRPRHRFPVSFSLPSSNAVVVYGGGPGIEPRDSRVDFQPANLDSAGLGLPAAGGTITLRDADGRLVARVVYPAAGDGAGSSISRRPEPNGPFVLTRLSALVPSTPGWRSDGSAYRELESAPEEGPVPPLEPTGPPVIRLAASREPTGTALRLQWEAEPGRTYRVWAADTPEGPYRLVSEPLGTGSYTLPLPPGSTSRILRVSSP